ncbi:helix-turn-helix domain-containing protein [Enterobacter sp. 22466]|uniref:helix-turn-helix domain-containing protein n=1 Tax=Enterobacter sp. 22466 TaxID=3453924 RepID=UPI003F85D4D1
MNDAENDKRCDLRPSFLWRKKNVSDTSFVMNEELVKMTAISSDAYFSVSCKRKRSGWVRPFYPLILAIHGRAKIELHGQWCIEILPVYDAATLLAFSENAEEGGGGGTGHFPVIKIDSDKVSSFIIKESSEASIAEMLVLNRQNQEREELSGFYDFIRGSECYWIIKYLLSMLASEGEKDMVKAPGRVYEICSSYGVSQTYFRKLCHRYLHRGAKKQLRIWRAALSVLQLMESKNSVVCVAQDNGYASSSHFSTEIKTFFGITPKEFRRLESLLYE